MHDCADWGMLAWTLVGGIAGGLIGLGIVSWLMRRGIW